MEPTTLKLHLVGATSAGISLAAFDYRAGAWVPSIRYHHERTSSQTARQARDEVDPRYGALGWTEDRRRPCTLRPRPRIPRWERSAPVSEHAGTLEGVEGLDGAGGDEEIRAEKWERG